MAQTTRLASFGPVSHRLVVGADASAAGDVGWGFSGGCQVVAVVVVTVVVDDDELEVTCVWRGVVHIWKQYLSLPLTFLQEWPDSGGIHWNPLEWDRNPPECK